MICITGDHNHAANPEQIATKILRDRMKERILAETTSITKIYDEEIVKTNLSNRLTPGDVYIRPNISYENLDFSRKSRESKV
jgi:hypothetical protein